MNSQALKIITMYMVPVITVQNQNIVYLIQVSDPSGKNLYPTVGKMRPLYWPAIEQNFLFHYKCKSEWGVSYVLGEHSQNTVENLEPAGISPQ